VSVGLAAALLVTACGGDDSATGSSTTEGTDNGSTGAINNDPTAFINQVGTNTPISLDPVRSISNCDVAPLAAIYDTLVRVDAKGKLLPGLAASWSSPDPKTFEIKLQDGVKFQDGSAFDADAVKAHFDRAISDPQSTIKGDLQGVESVEVVDPLDVKLHLAAARAGILPSQLTGRAGMVPSPQAVESAGDQYGVSVAVGAGPYKMVSNTPKVDLKVQRWDGYFQPDKQLLGGIDFKGLAAELQVNRVESGELNYANMKDTDLPTVKAASDIDYKLTPSTQFGEIFINWNKAPFNDKKVRQALEHSIDRKLLADQLGEGAQLPAWGPLPPDSPAKSKDVEDLYPYDPAKAKSLLAEAGYPDGITVDAAVLDATYYQSVGAAIKDMVKAGGFNFNLKTISGQESNNLIYVQKSVDVAITAYAGNADPGVTLEAKYGSHGNSNPSGTTADGVDDLLAQAAATTDQDQRNELYGQVEKLVMENALAIPTYHNGSLVIFAKNVKNVTRGYTTCQVGNFIVPPVYVEKG
jgi:ABC-type transport system substrate-binding protein